MEIFFSVGEPSGDQHAAHLIEELKRRRGDVRTSGFGGPLMQKAGCRLLYPLTNLAVMGFLRVLPLLWQFYRLVRQAGRYFRESPPDAVVLVDFPGFNWWIARKAKAAGIPVYYYLPPQLWAWAPWRVKRMRKFVDHVLCSLPFEKQWYANRGVRVHEVGHPFFDEIDEYELDRQFCAEWKTNKIPVVAVLPGSRNQEVTRNWPLMLAVLKRLHQQHPRVRFFVACYRESHRKYCTEVMKRLDSSGLQKVVHLFVGKTPEIIQTAGCSLMVSGSVSLEMLARRTPAVVLYRANWGVYVLAKLLISCRFMSLPNLIADEELMPEFPSVGNPQPDIQKMTQILDDWLSNPEKLQQKRNELEHLRDEVVQTGATANTAQIILETLGVVGRPKEETEGPPVPEPAFRRRVKQRSTQQQ